MECPERSPWLESPGTMDKEQLRELRQRRRRLRVVICLVAAILPIVIISFLVTHLDMINMWRNKFIEAESQESAPGSLINSGGSGSALEQFPFDGAVDDEDGFDSGSPCVPIAFKTSDVLDTEDREIFQGIRTSFLPPQSAVLPPGCFDAATEGDDVIVADDVTREEFDPQDTLSQLLNFLLRRPRREVVNGGGGGGKSNYSQLTTADRSTTTTATKAISPSSSASVDNEEESIEVTTIDSSSTTTAKISIRPVPERNFTATSGEAAESLSLSTFWTDDSGFDSVREVQAAIMKKFMDTTVDPCDDFYQYACGNWEALNPIPKDRAAYDTFEMLRESLDLVLQDLLQNATMGDENMEVTTTNSETDSATEDADVTAVTYEEISDWMSNRSQENPKSAEQKAIDMFKSCMNYEILEQRGLNPLMELLKELGGWPVLDSNWNETQFDWLKLTAQLRLYNNDIFIVEWVAPDIKNSQENIIQFDQTSLGLPTRDYFLQPSNADYLEAYTEYMAEVIHLLGVDKMQADNYSKEIVAFEKELAQITQTPEERTNVSLLYRRMTINELHRQIPEIDWTLYLEIVLQREVNRTEKVVMFALSYMQSIVKLIDKTEKRTVANYLLWRFVRHRVNNLDDRFLDAKQRFYFVLFGREQSPPRWKACVTQVNANLGMAVGSMFVRRYFDELSKQDTLTMTHELQESFLEILNGTAWIDNSTKVLAAEKVNSMSLKIGYPDYILDSEDLNEKYEGLEIDPELYFENTLNVLKYMTKYEHDKLTEVVNKTTWHTAPAVVNAYYSRNKNQIMFPAGILQPPFYHKYFPKSLNYGGIGE